MTSNDFVLHDSKRWRVKCKYDRSDGPNVAKSPINHVFCPAFPFIMLLAPPHVLCLRFLAAGKFCISIYKWRHLKETYEEYQATNNDISYDGRNTPHVRRTDAVWCFGFRVPLMFVRHDDVICILGLGDNMTCRIGADSGRLSHQPIIQYRKQSNTISF